MTDRDRFERGQRGYGQQPRPWDRQRYQSETSAYPDEDRDRGNDRGYSRLGGAGEEEYERYVHGGQGSHPGSREARDYGGRDYGDERGYYGQERGAGNQYGQFSQGGQYGQRDWGRQRSSGMGGQYDSAMRDFGERSGYGYGGPRDSGGYEYGQQGEPNRGYGMQRNQFPYSGSALGSQRSYEAGRYGQGQSGQSYGQGPSGQYGYGQAGQRGRFAGHGPKGYKRSDERIREDVCDALMMHPDIDASDIEIKVSEGEVTLTGTVQDRDDKYTAEQLCDSIPGVRDVTNNVRVKRAGSGEQQSSSSSSDASRNMRGGSGAGTSNATQGGPSNNSRA